MSATGGTPPAGAFRVAGNVAGKLFGNAVSSAVGFGAGVAMSPVLAPVVRDIANVVNSTYSFVFPEPGVLAAGVSQGQVDHGKAERWASYHGVGADAFAALVNIANTGPGVPAAFDQWRRGLLDEPGFRRAVKRQGIEPEWIDNFVKMLYNPLPPADLARGIHRGLVPDPGLLQGTATPGPGKVPAYPVYGVDAIAEAKVGGFDRDHLGVLVGLQGNPMGPHEAAQAYFRDVIEYNDFLRAIAEGNTRNEWAQAILEQSRQIPTATQFMENALRGHHDYEWAVAQVARHGMTPEDALVLFQNQGRALNLHQITQAIAWGAKYNPAPTDEQDPYVASTLIGPVRPEFYELNEALKYTLPSALYFRTLQQNKVLTEPEAATWYRRLGWPPELAAQVAQAYATQTTSATKEASATDELTLYAGRRITRAELVARLEALGYDQADAERKADVVDARLAASARTTAIGDLHTRFKKSEITPDSAATAITQLEVAPEVARTIVAAWQVARDAPSGIPPTIGV